mgnify:CR=1 FL=1
MNKNPRNAAAVLSKAIGDMMRESSGLRDRPRPHVDSKHNSLATLKKLLSFSHEANKYSAWWLDVAIVQSECSAVQWPEGFRFYDPDRRLTLLWILCGFYEAMVSGNEADLWSISQVQERAAQVGFSKGPKSIAQYIRDAAKRPGWWNLIQDTSDGRSHKIMPTAKLAFQAHLTHLIGFVQLYSRLDHGAISTSVYAQPDTGNIDVSNLNKIRAHRVKIWTEMGYPVKTLQKTADWLRESNEPADETHSGYAQIAVSF